MAWWIWPTIRFYPFYWFWISRALAWPLFLTSLYWAYPPYTKELEKSLLEFQKRLLEANLSFIENRLSQLSKSK